jgi:C_GCAxxG_C_C family probable redox protein
MGGAGCACGALSGAVLGLGLFLGPTRADRRSAAGLRRLTRELYRRFIGEFGSACCGALCRASKGSGRSHFRQCTAITGRATQIAADIILRVKPEILKQLDGEFLARPGARMDAGLRRMMAQVVGER